MHQNSYVTAAPALPLPAGRGARLELSEKLGHISLRESCAARVLSVVVSQLVQHSGGHGGYEAFAPWFSHNSYCIVVGTVGMRCSIPETKRCPSLFLLFEIVWKSQLLPKPLVEAVVL